MKVISGIARNELARTSVRGYGGEIDGGLPSTACAPRANRRAFTLIELLVVIAIIGILASLTAVAVAKIKQDGQKKQAKWEMKILLNAINTYHTDTGSYPISSTTLGLATANRDDFTYDSGLLPGGSGVNNSEIMAILMDREKIPSTGAPTANLGHVKNTLRKNYLENIDMVEGTNLPGIGQDLVFRDPWGTPYIISIDLNYDDKCRDVLYRLSTVSRESAANGYNGLFNPSDATGASDDFQYPGTVMIWSLGPDRAADKNAANAGGNRDNILSWRE